MHPLWSSTFLPFYVIKKSVFNNITFTKKKGNWHSITNAKLILSIFFYTHFFLRWKNKIKKVKNKYNKSHMQSLYFPLPIAIYNKKKKIKFTTILLVGFYCWKFVLLKKSMFKRIEKQVRNS